MSKTGLAKTHKSLWGKGLLIDALCNAPSDKGFQRAVRHAFELDAMHVQGPYGSILREKVLTTTSGNENLHLWYCDPVALLTSLCEHNQSLFDIVMAATGERGTDKLKLILYFDGINPCNPLAPDPQKLLMACYWTFAQFPNWLLRRREG